MTSTCTAFGCKGTPAARQEYCRRCLRALVDIPVTEEVDPLTQPYEHVATCYQCSHDTFGIMLTRKQADRLRLVGVRCGVCKHGFVLIEELSKAS